MTIHDINSLKELFSKQNKIIITTHKNPDGDAIGSSLSLYLFLKQIEQNVNIIVPNDFPQFLKWMPNKADILTYENNVSKAKALIDDADIIFALDYNGFHRTGDMCEVLDQSNATKIMIDHHQQPDDFALYTYSDTSMSSTCEMIYNFIEKLDCLKYMSPDIATCIYVGIMTDTGSFRFRSTTSRTHQIIAKLIDYGADNTNIHNNVFDNNSYNKLQLLGRALSNLEFIEEYHAAYISLSQKELNEFDYKKGDTEGIVNYALSLKNCVIAAIFIEDEKNNIIKISLRSKGDFSVNEMSRKYFNGGGHTNAAGGRSETSLSSTIDKFISILPEYKTSLNNEFK